MEDIKSLSGLVHVDKDGGDDTSAKHWWKLCEGYSNSTEMRGYLRARKYGHRSSDSSDRVYYLVTRAQRGMISYHEIPTKELRSLCEARGLENMKGKPRQKVMLLLEQADENLKFPQFLELPPELRVAVYEFSFDVVQQPARADWHERRFKLEPPPLASVNKLLRKEVLPLFYGGGILEIEIRPWYREPSLPAMYRESRANNALFAIAPKLVLESVKHLQILVHQRMSSRQRLARRIDIFLPTINNSYRIIHTPEHDKVRWVTADQATKLEKDLWEVMAAMVPKEEGKAYQLQRGDIYPIRKVFQSLLLTE